MLIKPKKRNINMKKQRYVVYGFTLNLWALLHKDR